MPNWWVEIDKGLTWLEKNVLSESAAAEFAKDAQTKVDQRQREPEPELSTPGQQQWTFNELVNAAIADLRSCRRSALDPFAVTDFQQAERHLEDALTRYNSARYRMMGTWKRADPDKPSS